MSATKPDLALRGPFPVGVRHARLASGEDPARRLPTEIWYPAVPGQRAREEAPHPFHQPHRAHPDLDPLGARCPFVVFSHGNSGLRHQSTFLTTHLASWGYVVAAPDHVGNTLQEMRALTSDEALREAHRAARRRRPLDLLGVLRALLDEKLLESALPPLDADRVGVMGHSFGGWTALKLPRLESRVRAVCSLAPASEAFVGRKAFEPGELPLPERVATLVIAAREDVLVDLETSIHPLYERLGERARLEVIEGSDHFHFCDGIELLHKLHESNPRTGQLRPTRPLNALIDGDEMHALLCEQITRFFDAALQVDRKTERSGFETSVEEWTR